MTGVNLGLEETLDCGQCFRWRKQEDGSFCGVAMGRALHVSAETLPQVLKDPFWQNYFDMDLDYEGIRSEFSSMDPVLSEAAAFAPGIRILNQEPWEALCSFILSQNNNIARIKGIVERLCKEFGGLLPGGQYSFPSPERMAALSPEDLEPLHSGYRARYLVDAAARVAGGSVNLDALRAAPLAEAREQLMTIVGVGGKVADCVLLYGLHRLEAFPLDVWMKRAMHALFPDRTPDYFGPYAGIAQQYIFHYSRLHPEMFR